MKESYLIATAFEKKEEKDILQTLVDHGYFSLDIQSDAYIESVTAYETYPVTLEFRFSKYQSGIVEKVADDLRKKYPDRRISVRKRPSSGMKKWLDRKEDKDAH